MGSIKQITSTVTDQVKLKISMQKFLLSLMKQISELEEKLFYFQKKMEIK